MGRVAGDLDDPPGFPYTAPGVDILEGGKLTSNNVAGSSNRALRLQVLVLNCSSTLFLYCRLVAEIVTGLFSIVSISGFKSRCLR